MGSGDKEQGSEPINPEPSPAVPPVGGAEGKGPDPKKHEKPGSPDEDANVPAVESDSLDWSGTESTAKEIEPSVGKVYDPRPKEDTARRLIAYQLIWLLIGLVTMIVAMVWRGVIKVDEVKEFSVLLGPIVTLVSAATGFYYGTKAK